MPPDVAMSGQMPASQSRSVLPLVGPFTLLCVQPIAPAVEL